jgi:hypothetical protein
MKRRTLWFVPLLLVMCLPSIAPGQDKKTSDVNVVNPVTSPVPMTVQNTSALPVPVSNVGDHAYFPMRRKSTATVPEGFVGSFGNPVGSAVPADMRFVIEYVSFECSTSGAVEPARVWLSPAEKVGTGSFAFHSYPILLSKTPPDYAGKITLVGTQSQRWYHDGGQAVLVGISLNGAAPAGGVVCNVELSGFTVPMP